MMRFAFPPAFVLLLPLAAAGWALLAPRRRLGILFAPISRLPPARLSWRRAAAAAAPILFLAGVALLTVALARPQRVLDKTIAYTDGIAIQMVVDVSGSMEALDFSTRERQRTRLDAVKDMFAAFIEQRAGDQIGLVTFGGFAASRVPLTLDHRALLHVLKGVQIPKPSLDASGNLANQEELMTAIGDAIATACARLEPSAAKSKIVVLLSDGESNTGLIQPEEAARAAQALGIKIFTIGVGSNGRAPFLARDVFGRTVLQYADVRLDEALLQRLAQSTGGRYFNARDSRGLARALEIIDTLEKSRIRQNLYTQRAELFPRVAWPGLLLAALAVSLHLLARREVI